MAEPLTEELLGELLSARDLGGFLQEHNTAQMELAQYLQLLLQEKGLKRSRVVRMADLNDTFGYQIFQGTRHPSRDKVLQIAFAMALSVDECNHALVYAGTNPLYCKNRRDAIILFCLDRGCSLQKVNEELYRFGEQTIC